MDAACCTAALLRLQQHVREVCHIITPGGLTKLCASLTLVSTCCCAYLIFITWQVPGGRRWPLPRRLW
jgi:hypothetical protein